MRWIQGGISSTRKKDTIIELRKRDEFGLFPLASTATAALVGIDAIEATRTDWASGALVFWWVWFTLLAKWWFLAVGACGSCQSCISFGHLGQRSERRFRISPATTTRLRNLNLLYIVSFAQLQFIASKSKLCFNKAWADTIESPNFWAGLRYQKKRWGGEIKPKAHINIYLKKEAKL